MKGLERALDLLRHFVDSNNWDYCIVWKLGDGPSRFIQWLGCCCGGGEVKRKKRGEDNQLVPFCRDLYFKHRISSKACEALACFPSSISLYSGIHGEAVNSSQAKWLSPVSSSSSKSVGTRVLIPVLGGLIELFAAKHIAKDEKIIDFITANFNVIKQEGMVTNGYSSLSECSLDPFPGQNLHTLQAANHMLSLLPAAQILYLLNQSGLDGSSTVSNLIHDHLPFDSAYSYLPHTGVLKNPVEKPSGTRNSNHREEQNPVIQKPEHGSKNLVTERNRRNRINDGLLALRSLVPKITKMNKAAILGDAVEYITELEEKIKKLRNELKEVKEEERGKSNTEIMALESEASFTKSEHLSPNETNQDQTNFGEKKKIEVQVEVKQISKTEFLIRLFCEKKRGGFGRLMDAIYSLGLQVADANMTTLNDLVLTILKVEAISKDIQLKKLRESLLKLRG